MRSRSWLLLLRALAVFAFLTFLFILLIGRARIIEATVAVRALDMIESDRVEVQPGTSTIAVYPEALPAVRATVSTASSALPSILAIGCLAWLLPRQRGRKHLRAALIAMGAVSFGNIARIVLAIHLGLATGRSSLIGLDDEIGGFLTYSYILGGYLLIVFLLAPARGDRVSFDGKSQRV